MKKSIVRYGVKVEGKLLCLDADYSDPVSVNIEHMERLITPSIKKAEKRLRQFRREHYTKAGKVCVVVFSVSVS